ncbi:MAG: hypothetical protein ABI072_10265 [Edaphobacter sp.]
MRAGLATMWIIIAPAAAEKERTMVEELPRFMMRSKNNVESSDGENADGCVDG